MNKIKVIFIGTSDFGIPAFKALIRDENFSLTLAITQPDRPAGRKQLLIPSPIKTEALKNDIHLLQPEKISLVKNEIASLSPDIIIVAAYGQIIPEEILNIPKHGCLNLHASLLPKYRGAAVIQAAILNGDKETGLTVIKMDKGLDTGPILVQMTVPIEENDTTGTLHDRLAELSPEFLISTIKKYVSGKIDPKPQSQEGSSYAKTIAKGDGLIDWSKPAIFLERFLRAMSPWPTAWTWLKGKQLKIISAQNKPIEINSYKPGKTFKYNSGLAVQCGKDALIIKRLKLEGKNELSSEEFLRGQKEFMGSVLG